MISKAVENNLTVNRRQTGVVAISDEDLLLEYRVSGDRDVFAQLVGRYESELYSYLARYLGDAQLAQDAFQNAFLQIHLKCDQFQEGRRLRPWLYTIATNQAIDAQRRNKRHRHVSLDGPVGCENDGDIGRLLDLLQSNEPDPQSQAHDEEHREWLREALDGLPEHLRRVIHLVYYQGLKYREAAEALGIPVGTVKSRMHAAILQLNESWICSHESTE